MKPINAITLSGFLLTAIALYFLSYVPAVPVWSVFITWACFFHLDGGANRNHAYFATIRHIGLGAFAAWLTALLLLLPNPWAGSVLGSWWAPILIAVVIALLMRLSSWTRFAVTPAIIYGYASIWAFLSVPGLFSHAYLTAFTMQNALLAIGLSVLLGASAAYLNAMLVSWLCRFNTSET